MSHPVVYADFHNVDPRGRLRLICNGTFRDLADQQISMTEGLQLTLSDGEENEADGELHFAEEEHIWVAVIDWNQLRPCTEIKYTETISGG